SSKRVTFHTSNAVAAVRGTVLDIVVTPCGSDVEDFIDCTQGDVEVTTSTSDTDDPQGTTVSVVPAACGGAADAGDAGAGDGAADGGDCISGTWVGSVSTTPCGTTTQTFVVSPSGSGYTVDTVAENAQLDWWFDAGFTCGTKTLGSTNAVW